MTVSLINDYIFIRNREMFFFFSVYICIYIGFVFSFFSEILVVSLLGGGVIC
jgi:hypothetical protein